MTNPLQDIGAKPFADIRENNPKANFLQMIEQSLNEDDVNFQQAALIATQILTLRNDILSFSSVKNFLETCLKSQHNEIVKCSAETIANIVKDNLSAAEFVNTLIVDTLNFLQSYLELLFKYPKCTINPKLRQDLKILSKRIIEEKNRKFAALVLLEQLLGNAKTQFVKYLGSTIEIMWSLLQNDEIPIHSDASRCLGECMKQEEQRNSEQTRMRYQGYVDQLYYSTQGNKLNEIKLHGGLLALGEMLKLKYVRRHSKMDRIIQIINRLKDTRLSTVRYALFYILPPFALAFRSGVAIRQSSRNSKNHAIEIAISQSGIERLFNQFTN
ncbi:MAG: hypothetical protein EZS28_007962 [Streblomastix strix]|uniref:Uncharacterized protein n=1 Tax=Streblomastix strix TaxID=222440 RepID=A0A5J4WPG7_9EUKA|nr:MAG: hypothetical protein EZS28_007962 [Streblomastix strix]